VFNLFECSEDLYPKPNPFSDVEIFKTHII